MTSNISVSVTADTTQMRAQLALAQADLRQYQATLKATAADIKASGTASTEQSVALSKAASSVNSAQSEVTRYKAALSGMTEVEHEGVSVREAAILSMEAMEGKVSRLSKGVARLGADMGGVAGKITLAAGALGMMAVGLEHVIELEERRKQATEAGEVGALGSSISQDDADAAVARMRQIEGVTTEEAGKIVHTLAAMPGTSKAVLSELGEDVPAMALRLQVSNEAAAQKIAQAYQLEGNAALELMNKTRASTETIQAYQKAVADNQIAQARRIVTEQVHQNALDVSQKTNSGQVKTWQETADWKPDQTPMMQRASGPDTSGAAQEAAERAERLEKAVGAVNDEMAVPKAQSWSEQTSQALQVVENTAELTARQAGKSWKDTDIARAQADVGFWQKSLQETREGSKEQEDAQHHLLESQRQLDNLRSAGSASAAKQAVEAQIQALSAQQAANTKDYDAWMALEQQKLAVLRQAYGERSAQYQEELRHETVYEQQFAAQKGRLDLESAQRQNERGQIALRGTVQNLQTEVATHQMTREQEVALARQAIEEEGKLELTVLDAVIAGLQEGTEAYQKAVDARQKLAQQLNTQLAQNAREQATLAEQAAERQEAAYRNAFEGVSSSASSAFAGYVSGSSTLVSAQQQVGRAILSSATTTAAQVAGRWIASEMAHRLASQETAVAVDAAQAQGQSGVWTLLTRSLGLWKATEQAKLASTTTANTGEVASNTASEGTKTEAHLTGIASRKAADNAAATQGAATRAATGSATIMGDAARAFSATYASVSEIPIVGWIMAPVAASAAFAAVAAYSAMASLDVGAWEVPKDMTAHIHQGEMVVPKTFAAGLRAAPAGVMSLPEDMTARGRQGEIAVPKAFAAGRDSSLGGVMGLPEDLGAHIRQGEMGGAQTLAAGLHSSVTTDNSDNSSVSATYAPTFHGAAADLRSQSARQFEEFKQYVTDLGRNGRLALPGR